MGDFSWYAMTLPYLEAQPVYSQFDFKVGILHNNNNEPRTTPVVGFACPSDLGRMTLQETASATARHKRLNGNYVVNWGPCNFAQWYGSSLMTPAGVNGRLSGPFTFTLAYDFSYIQDGTSNTLLMSEVLIPTDSPNCQTRIGDLTCVTNGQCFTTWYTPNSKAPLGDLVHKCPDAQYQGNMIGTCGYGAAGIGSVTNTDRGYTILEGNGQIVARSMHRDGVNVVMCDGAVRFVSDAIAPYVWSCTATAQGGETTSF